MIKKSNSMLLSGVFFAAVSLVAVGPCYAETETAAEVEPETDEEDEIELERTIDLQATLVGVEAVPRSGRAIARFRILEGEYSGALFSFAYDYSRPIRLRSWDVHNESGYRRIGGARVKELPLGQWDYLLVPGSRRPVGEILLTLLQHDLNEDEEQRRWHFKELVSIAPARWNGYDPEEIRTDPQAARADR
jgi:hypothetical protein